MFGALPPGAWWEVANGAEPVFEPYADKAGDAAVQAARTGDLELSHVSFAYPVRKEMAGVCFLGGGSVAGLSVSMRAVLQAPRQQHMCVVWGLVCGCWVEGFGRCVFMMCARIMCGGLKGEG